MTPLHFAALGGHLDICEELVNRYKADNIEFNVNDDVYGATPLHYAASSGNLRLVEYLIRMGANVRTPANNNDLPLHYAVSSGGTLDIVKYLINNGAEPTITSSDGMSPIQYAALGGNIDVVRFLIDTKNVDYNLTENRIHTLYFAVRGGSLAVTRYLVSEKRVNVNVRDNVNATPLHDAASHGYLDIVKFLLRCGADANARSLLNETPLDCARGKGHSKVVECLRSPIDCIADGRRGRRNIESILSNMFDINMRLPPIPIQGHVNPQLSGPEEDFNQGTTTTTLRVMNGVYFGGITLLMNLVAGLITKKAYETPVLVQSNDTLLLQKLNDAERKLKKAIAEHETVDMPI